ncbi:putative magnesium transporter MRS2-G [Hibiscus syriacus]|uniref:Magnesium transporter n=1 Tax=Hibiscus syriacus TaxID=106335 RepID=A0A6A2Y4N0_HIBSY|nr:putative magnesium transporter MRS2-G [Hibiscus syriacus]
MGKNPFSFIRSSSRKRRSKHKKAAQSPVLLAIGAVASSSTPPPSSINSSGGVVGLVAKAKKKATGARLWMRFDTKGASELVEYDKSTIIQKASLPARDLRILGPIFSQSSTIIAREKAMIVNLEFVKAIVTASEVLILDPLQQEVLQFVDQLRQQFSHKSALKTQGAGTIDASENEMHVSTPITEVMEGLLYELPFEFQVLEIALEVVCSFLDRKVVDLGTDSYPVLDELARNVSTKNLEHVRDEIEHLLDDNEDMAHLYLTRKQVHNLQLEALLRDEFSNTICNHPPRLPRLGSNRSVSLVSHYFDDNNVEDLEMLLEAYFVRLDRMRNKIYL